MPNYPFPISSKLPRTGETIFSVMSALANEHKAINLSQGFPGFEPDPSLIKKVNKAMQQGFNQYAPMAGSMNLRQQVSNSFSRRDGVNYDPEKEITITAGATQAIFTAITALIKEGDEVILFSPAYDCYTPALELMGAKIIYIQMNAPDYRIPWDEVKRVMNRRTKMIIANSPHNPTGTVWSSTDVAQLEELVLNSDALVLSDEVYEHMVFDGKKHVSAASRDGLASRSLIVGSFGKTFHVTGWKIGYIAGPSALMNEFRKVHQYNVFSTNSAMQEGIANYMKKVKPEETLSSFYQAKRDLFREELSGSNLELLPCEGTYFQLIRFRDVSSVADTEVAKLWTEQYKVASIPVSVFYPFPVQEHVLRFCFAKEDGELKKAAKRLRKITAS